MLATKRVFRTSAVPQNAAGVSALVVGTVVGLALLTGRVLAGEPPVPPVGPVLVASLAAYLGHLALFDRVVVGRDRLDVWRHFRHRRTARADVRWIRTRSDGSGLHRTVRVVVETTAGREHVVAAWRGDDPAVLLHVLRGCGYPLTGRAQKLADTCLREEGDVFVDFWTGRFNVGAQIFLTLVLGVLAGIYGLLPLLVVAGLLGWE